MQRKLKAVFRSSSRKKSQQFEGSDSHIEPKSARSRHDVRQTTSLDERRSRQSADPYTTDAPQQGRSRPLSSIYDPRRESDASRAQPATIDHAQNRPAQRPHDSIASNYKAYLPALSPVDDSENKDYMSMGGDRRLITGESETRHEEDVADRNIDRYNKTIDTTASGSLPRTTAHDVAPETSPGHRATRASVESINSAAPSAGTAKYSVGRDVVTKGGLVDSILPHTETSAHERDQWKQTDWPSRAARGEPQVGLSRRRSRVADSGDGDDESFPKDAGNHDRIPPRTQGEFQEASIAVDGHSDIEREIEQLLDGVVDLRNTVDEDKTVEWAPAVTHEVVKPHEHEIIQHKIYREIHNYEYYHRIQPVYDLEVLPPRHWIPNPDGQGLIEISADELPKRTGNNRRWKVVREDVEIPLESGPVWRTQPEIIEHPTTITDEGFERKETTIIYPPTLQDMSDYDGLVQPVHFDHKTGKRWLGEITTMHKLRQDAGQVADPQLSMSELDKALPDIPAEEDVPPLSQSPNFKRKPVTGPVPARLGALGSPKSVTAVA